jgi:hypothetical protein
VALAPLSTHAESDSRTKALRGTILVSAEPPPASASSEADMITALTKIKRTSIERDRDQETASWSFFYTAFLDKKAGTRELSLDVYSCDKPAQYVTFKRVLDVDPDTQILSARANLSEDDGLKPGGCYQLRLVGGAKGKDRVFARTELTVR